MKHKYLLGSYDDDDVLLHAVGKIRKEGYRIHEAYTPFPVHGLDHAMGLQETRLHVMGFIFGAIGTLFALFAMTYIGAVDWPVIVGGKPFFNFPAFGPITFELTVLFASVGMVIVFYIRNNFSIFRDAEIIDPRITDDRFVLAFCTKQYPDKADQEAIAKILNETGAVEIRETVLENEILPNLYVSDEDGHHDDHGHGHHH